MREEQAATVMQSPHLHRPLEVEHNERALRTNLKGESRRQRAAESSTMAALVTHKAIRSRQPAAGSCGCLPVAPELLLANVCKVTQLLDPEALEKDVDVLWGELCFLHDLRDFRRQVGPWFAVSHRVCASE